MTSVLFYGFSGLPLSFEIWKSETAKSMTLEVTLYTVGNEGTALNFGSHGPKSKRK
jgi:hypothetical protein